MSETHELLADIRELTLILHDEQGDESTELTEKDRRRLTMIRDVMRQILADGVPDYPIIEYVRAQNVGLNRKPSWEL